MQHYNTHSYYSKNCDCFNCRIGLNNDQSFIGHVCSNDNCTQIFTNIQHLQEHMVCHGKKSFVCDWPNCTKSFAFKEVFRLHLSIHAENSSRTDADFNIAGIKKENESINATKTTRSVAFGQNPISPNLGIIQDVVTDIKIEPFSETNEYPTTEKSSIVNHNVRTEVTNSNNWAGTVQCSTMNGGSNVVNRVKCDFKSCGKLFQSRHQLLQHIRTHKGSYATDFENSMNSINQRNSRKHYRKKKKTPAKKSSSESTRIRRASGYPYDEQSNRMPNGKYGCDWKDCNKSYSMITNLYRHRKIHMRTNVKKHMCDFDGCGKLFPYRSNLLIHKQIHTMKEKLICNINNCRSSFSRLDLLNKHRNVQHDNKGN